MENLKETAIVSIVGLIAYSVATVIMIYACIANLGSLLFSRVQSYLLD